MCFGARTCDLFPHRKKRGGGGVVRLPACGPAERACDFIFYGRGGESERQVVFAGNVFL